MILTYFSLRSILLISIEALNCLNSRLVKTFSATLISILSILTDDLFPIALTGGYPNFVFDY